MLRRDVFASEFSLPEYIGTPILEIERKLGVKPNAAHTRPVVTEKLFWIEPP